eukprot:TRINITY_DN29430_c0_g1_i1.p1 TRINITY_DN29430_c0_g1~~TRINITY_DN29430_c0_g1_i1.p1  ORF type:complete len:768 (-),score=99.45 TRINITY_DN29430_c0_g1_i1:1441-3744(-)
MDHGDEYEGESRGAMGVESKMNFEPGDDQSPVEEVALTVNTHDDPTLPVLTFRMWLIGLITCAFLSFVNQYFWFRQASLVINPIAATILTLYLGRFFAKILPTSPIFTIGGKEFFLNEGPFGVKEHVLITIFANCGSAFGNGNAYAIDIVTIVRQFYKRQLGFFPCLLLIWTTQCIGYGWAGLMRRYLVDPSYMWWPTNLVNVSLFRTLHEVDNPPKGQLTRLHFFGICAIIMFSYYALPDYLIPITTSMSWVCWVWPKNVMAHQIGSGQYGLGVGAVALDWSTMEAFLLSPLATPWFAIANIFFGFFIIAWVIVPICYWNNIYDAKRYPILSSSLFSETGKRYPTLKLLTPDLTLNVTRYEELGQPHLSVFFALGYGFGFAALTATIVHVALWNGPDIVRQSFAAANEDKPDVHVRLLQRYAPIPLWWYIALSIISMGLAFLLLGVWREFQLEWYGLIAAVALSAFFTLPIGVIAATTNQVPGLNIITEMIWGYLKPGQPIANVLFKTYGYISMTQAVSFLQDFKLGVYMKIPPRSMFVVQIVGTLFAGLINLGTAQWIYSSVEGGNVCVTDLLPSNSQWTCPSANVFFSASVIWGLIGPKRFFGPGTIYVNLNWFFLGGAFLPLPFWLLYQALPNLKILRKINTPIILTGLGILPPASPVNFTSWFAMGFIFNYLIFKFRKNWWVRYNYVLSAALDTGVMFMAIIIFVGVQLDPPSGNYLAWWGAGLTLVDNCKYARCATEAGACSISSYCPLTEGTTLESCGYA